MIIQGNSNARLIKYDRIINDILHFIPRPENEGAFCVGERIRYKICNVQSCPDNELGFRAHQCSKFNNETYREKKYDWLPYFDSRK